MNNLRSLANVLLVFVFSTLVFIPEMEAQDFLDQGMKSLEKKDYDRAISLLRQAVEKTPKSATSHYFLGEAYFQKGVLDSAGLSFNNVVRYDDEYSPAYRRLGDILVQQKRYSDAIPQYQRGLKLDSKNFDLLFSLGVCYLNTDSVDKAIIEFTKAREKNPKDPSAYIGLGDAYLKQGVPTFAIEQYKKAVELDSTLLIAHLKLARLYTKQRMGADALKEFRFLTQLEPENPDWWWEAGHSLYFNDRYDSAIPFLKKYTELKPKSAKGHLEYGRSLAKSKPKNHKEAIPEVLQAMQLDTTRSLRMEAWRQLADSYFWTKNYGKSDTAFKNLSAFDTLTVNEYEKWGLAAHSARDTLAAVLAYENAIRLGSNVSDVYRNVFALLSAQGERGRAIGIFKKRIDVDPKSADESYYYMGTAYYTMGEYDSSRIYLQKAISIRDSLPYSLWLARCYVALNDKNRRRTAYEHVIRIAQDNNASNHKKEIGEAYGFIGLDQLLDATSNNEWERPVETLKKAIANNPDLPSQSDLRTWLGQSEMYLYFKKVKETGDRKGNDFLKQDACSEFNKVLKIDPRSTNAKNGKEKLDCP